MKNSQSLLLPPRSPRWLWHHPRRMRTRRHLKTPPRDRKRQAPLGREKDRMGEVKWQVERIVMRFAGRMAGVGVGYMYKTSCLVKMISGVYLKMGYIRESVQAGSPHHERRRTSAAGIYLTPDVRSGSPRPSLSSSLPSLSFAGRIQPLSFTFLYSLALRALVSKQIYDHTEPQQSRRTLVRTSAKTS
jgi:hypothetical protein